MAVGLSASAVAAVDGAVLAVPVVVAWLWESLREDGARPSAFLARTGRWPA